MFARSCIVALVIALVLVATGLAAGPVGVARPEARHIVRPGDTLWSIAQAHYRGDPRAAVWRIEQRNELGDGSLQPGTVLYLPP